MLTRATTLNLIFLSGLMSLASCKTRSSASELKEIWFNLLDSKWKAAQEVSDKNEYIRAFDQLPLQASLTPAPWSDAIYPDTSNGLAFRFAAKNNATQYRLDPPAQLKDLNLLSPIEKYDLLLDHQQWELTGAERLRTSAKDGKAVDPRRSLAQDWAAASIIFAEPGPIRLSSESGRSIPFGSSDIKALLTRFVSQHSLADEGVETRSLGGVCRLDSDSFRRVLEARTIAPDSWKELKFEDCFSINAGAFHLALTNLLGLRQESFILDPVLDQEFTHFPVVSFKSESLGTAVEDDNHHQNLQIKTLVSYIVPSPSSSSKNKAPSLRSSTYRYTIELDEAGDIVGGTWLGQDAPQVAWMQNRPKFTADDSKLETLYTTSVSLPARMAMRNFASVSSDDPQTLVRDVDPLVVNKKYRLELSGDVPRGADGLKIFLKSAFRPLGNVSIYRNTFADEDATMSIEVQFHNPTTVRAVKQALRAHSNGRSEVAQILR
ncbi:MAG: hypothetical protein H7318_16975 [Oligoflexus sp.]|nr:hypothetical protein [Oligoflexus sp.]